MITCETLEDKIMPLIHGELPDYEDRQVRRHITACDKCRSLFVEYSDLNVDLLLSCPAYYNELKEKTISRITS